MASDRELDGWLAKLAKAKSTRTSAAAAPLWQRRFFQLKGDMLYFWNTEEDAKGGPSTAKWSLDLGAKGALATPFSDPTQPPDDSRIELIAGDEKFSFQADSEVEAEMWIAALTTPSRSGGGVPSAATPAAPAGGGCMFGGMDISSAPSAPQASAFDFMAGGATATPDMFGGMATAPAPATASGFDFMSSPAAPSPATASAFDFLGSGASAAPPPAAPGGMDMFMGMSASPTATLPAADAEAIKTAEKEKRRKEKEAKKAAEAAAAAAAAAAAVVAVPDEDLDLQLKAAEAEVAASNLVQKRRLLYLIQADSIKKRAALAADVARSQAAVQAAVQAQGEAAMAEDYERAAALGSQIEYLKSQEADAIAGQAKAANEYDSAEIQKEQVQRAHPMQPPACTPYFGVTKLPKAPLHRRPTGLSLSASPHPHPQDPPMVAQRSISRRSLISRSSRFSNRMQRTAADASSLGRRRRGARPRPSMPPTTPPRAPSPPKRAVSRPRRRPWL
jgi:hypothetical protein